jgi:hypothetical protein
MKSNINKKSLFLLTSLLVLTGCGKSNDSNTSSSTSTDQKLASNASITISSSADEIALNPEDVTISETFHSLETKKQYNTRVLPSTGYIKLLVIPVLIPGYETIDIDGDEVDDKEKVKTDIEEAFFGTEGDSNLGYESVASFYKKSSYNQLNLTGTVTDYFNLASDSTLGYSVYYVVSTTTSSFSLEFFENTTLTSTVTNTSANGTLSYKVNDVAATDLNSVYSGDHFTVTVAGTPSTGKTFILEEKETSGNYPQTKSVTGGEGINFTFYPQTNFTITLSEVSISTITVVNPTTGSGSISLTMYDGNHNTATATNGIPTGSTMYISGYSYYTAAVNYTVHIEGTATDLTGTISASSGYGSYFSINNGGAISITGKMTITFVLAA